MKKNQPRQRRPSLPRPAKSKRKTGKAKTALFKILRRNRKQNWSWTLRKAFALGRSWANLVPGKRQEAMIA